MAEATQAAAGMITGGILEEAVGAGYAVDERTVEAIKEQAEPAPEVEVPAAPPDPVDEIVESLQAQGVEETDDISAELEQDDDFEVPDFEAEVDAELLNEEIAGASEDGYEPEWEADPVDNAARREAMLARREANYYKNITAKRERKKWEAEADKHFPLWRVRGDISATSRRGFLKAAKQSNDAAKPFMAEGIRKAKEQLEAERAQVRAEEKTRAEEAWGKPTVAQNAPSAEAEDLSAALKDARRNQDLAKVLSIKRAMAEQGGGEE